MPLVLVTSAELPDSDYVCLAAQQTAERREGSHQAGSSIEELLGDAWVTSGSEGDSLCSSCLTVCSEGETCSSNLKVTVCCKWSS